MLDTIAAPFSTAPDVQSKPQIAFSGTDHFLVVWEDSRTWDTSGIDIYGTRFTLASGVQDPAGMLISTTGGHQGHQTGPALAFYGPAYLVVWSDDPTTLPDSHIVGVRVNTNGTTTDLAFPICGSGTAQGQPDVAFDGTNLLVVWAQGASDGPDIYGTRVHPDGFPFDPCGVPISVAGHDQSAPAVVANGAWLVVWRPPYGDRYRHLRHAGCEQRGAPRIPRASRSVPPPATSKLRP